MSNYVHGIHHVTAIAGNPQENVDFYVKILGLRLVKKTVNFDDPHTYHFYYGNETGNPGTILTFFPFTAHGLKGRRGTGQLTVTSFSIPENAMGYWTERLKQYNVNFKSPFARFHEEVLAFHDPDGLELELVSTAKDARPAWERGPIPEEFAVRGFYHVTLSVEAHERTADLMTATLGFRQVGESRNRFRYEVGNGVPGTLVDILCQPDNLPGRTGVGVVHHVAWRISNDESQLNLRKELVRLGYNVTPVMDRNYFHSIYFREPGHILFEVATDPPGFAIDEDLDKLGANLMLPIWLEQNRSEIEQVLPPINVPY